MNMRYKGKYQQTSTNVIKSVNVFIQHSCNVRFSSFAEYAFSETRNANATQQRNRSYLVHSNSVVAENFIDIRLNC